MSSKQQTVNSKQGTRGHVLFTVYRLPFTLHQHAARGSMLVQVVVYIAIATTLLVGLIVWLGATINVARATADRERAFQIAEAGIDYYRWHLAHARSDYQDGTGHAGPYTHAYTNAAGVRVGEFVLTITPPPAGGTTVTIASTGKVDSNPRIARTIEAKMAIPSYAKYAVLANDDMRFGEQTTIEGLTHSNYGVRMDGLARNMVTSAEATYTDPDHSGGKEFAVHTHTTKVDDLPPNPLPSDPNTALELRPDIFAAGRTISVPRVDFASLTSDLASIKSAAQTAGTYYANSGGLGYHMTLRADGTYLLTKVTAVKPSGNSRKGCWTRNYESGWGTLTIATEQALGTYTLPNNGVVFFEDDLWVEGTVSNIRSTIAVGRFPEAPGQYKKIILNHNLQYTHYDGNDVLGLIAQGDIRVGLESDNVLRIDGALIAQNGKVSRFEFNSACTPYDVRSSLTLFGSLATNQRYGFAWTTGSGYQSVNLQYDANLLYNPPPMFPHTSDQYQTVSWEETTFDQ